MNTFQRKIAALLALAGPEVEWVEEEVREGSEWEGGVFGLRRLDRKYFSGLFLRLFELVPGGQKVKKHLQPLFVQESSAYTREACFKTIGNIALPVRVREVDGSSVIEVGVTVKRSPGSFGEPTFTGPRASLSNVAALTPAEQEKVLYHHHVRPDPQRLTGRVNLWLVKGDADQYKNCAWFSLDEVPLVLEHELMEDPGTRELLQYVMGHRPQIALAFFAPPAPAYASAV